MPVNLSEDKLRELLILYGEKKSQIQSRLADFARVQPSEWLYELLYCLLTPQSSAEHADKAITKLRIQNFSGRAFDPEQILRAKEHYIRFHKTKAKLLLKARGEFPAIKNGLQNGSAPAELREWLVSNVKGLGLKEATHFLRNIGMNDGLAILDRHILRNLRRYGVIRSAPKSLSKKEYFRIEERFVDFSERIGIPVDELDLLFWSMETGEIRK